MISEKRVFFFVGSTLYKLHNTPLVTSLEAGGHGRRWRFVLLCAGICSGARDKRTADGESGSG